MKITIEISDLTVDQIFEAAKATAEELDLTILGKSKESLVSAVIKEMFEGCFETFNDWYNADKYSTNLFEAFVRINAESKGNWQFERSSGFAGYRCTECATWEYENKKLRCDCDKK